ncbi:MAG: HlyC/CorC family transporter [Gammaproteobacteria bacterium]
MSAGEEVPERDEPTPRREAKGGWLARVLQAVSGEPRDREDLLEDLREAGESGLIDAEAASMVEGVLAVADQQVRDIMVARSAMVVVEQASPLREVLGVVVESGHSRFPVIGDDRDQVVGILLAKDLLRHVGDDSGFNLARLLRPPVFVPESKRLNVLLREFRASRNHIAIVVDEYGGVAGLVTIEDVIEQIIGDIDDEYDVEEDLPVRRDGPCSFTVNALTRLEDFNEAFGVSLPEDEFDTIGGYVAHAFGRVPRRGDHTTLDGLEFRVLRAAKRRIELLRVVTAEEIQLPDERPG